MWLGGVSELRLEQGPSNVDPARWAQSKTSTEPPESAIHSASAPPDTNSLQYFLQILNSELDQKI